MASPICPDPTELLAWLNDSSSAEQCQSLATHIDACPWCQQTLGQLCEGEERGTSSAAGDDLLDDLRRQPTDDDLEAEPECARAVSLSEATTGFQSRPDRAPGQPEAGNARHPTHLGHYEILGLLGRGGMGVVYKARHRKLDRLVAIKVLSARNSLEPAAVARFEREMKTVALLSHPHIVAAHDADLADGTPFLVLEYVDGVDLRSLIKAQGALPVEKAIDYIIQAARGLRFAHESGIVHRDVKPANLMLERGGTVKVLDLGLARILPTGEALAELTDTGMMMGTADYLAPEQAASTRDSDARADVYGLGCSLYYLLTGRPLYDGDTVLQKVLAHRDRPIPSLQHACPQAPAALAKVLAKMVAKRPAQRYQTMAAVIAALEPLLVASATLPTASAPPRSKRRLLWGALGLLLLGLVGALVPLFLSKNEPAEEETGAADRPDPLPTLKRGGRAGQVWAGNGLKMKFCWCPPGRFTMGSPKNEPGRAWFECPQVEVVLSRGFWLAKFEVTQKEWEQVMGTRPSRFQGKPRLPVDSVTWAKAARFCDVLTERERDRGSISERWQYRLPTEAQWEYACRAGTTTAYNFGTTSKNLGDHAWHGHNAGIRSHEVGQKKPNRWGLHDMHGNEWEWCRDWFGNKLPGGTDPEVTKKSHARVIRGGGWNAAPELCRSAFRSGQKPAEPGHLLGFRVAIVQVAVPADRPNRPRPGGRQ